MTAVHLPVEVRILTWVLLGLIVIGVMGGSVVYYRYQSAAWARDKVKTEADQRRLYDEWSIYQRFQQGDEQAEREADAKGIKDWDGTGRPLSARYHENALKEAAKAAAAVEASQKRYGKHPSAFKDLPPLDSPHYGEFAAP
jgi:hypothetical protein